MTGVDRRMPSDSTSAGCAMLVRPVRGPVLVGCMLFGLGTRRTRLFGVRQHRSRRAVGHSVDVSTIR